MVTQEQEQPRYVAINTQLTDRQKQALFRRRAMTGESVANMIRRAIDEFLAREAAK